MKTLEELQAMGDDELRVMCAGLCGWNDVHFSPSWNATIGTKESPAEVSPGTETYKTLPNFPQDLNAMHEAVGALIFSKRKAYRQFLQQVCSTPIHPDLVTMDECIDATTRQRCIAFTLTKQEI